MRRATANRSVRHVRQVGCLHARRTSSSIQKVAIMMPREARTEIDNTYSCEANAGTTSGVGRNVAGHPQTTVRRHVAVQAECACHTSWSGHPAHLWSRNPACPCSVLHLRQQLWSTSRQRQQCLAFRQQQCTPRQLLLSSSSRQRWPCGTCRQRQPNTPRQLLLSARREGQSVAGNVRLMRVRC